MQECWLCLHAKHEDARMQHMYMVENAGGMSPHVMASEMSRDLQAQHPDTPGTSAEHCYEHITQHTVNPVMRMSTMLRSLFSISDKMKKSLLTCDEDGNAVPEPKMIETYLKVQSQILMIYGKNETAKLLFQDKS